MNHNNRFIGLVLLLCACGAEDTPEVPIEARVIDSDFTTDTVLTNININADATDYVLSGCLRIKANLVIEAGVNIEFARDSCLIVGDFSDEGSLQAVGTALLPIRFFGEQAGPAYWRGIAFRSMSTANALTFVTINGAGGLEMGAGFESNASVVVSYSALLRMQDCLVQNGGGFGIDVLTFPGQTPDFAEFARNVLRSQAKAPMRIPAYLLGVPDSASTFSTNTEAYVEVYGTLMRRDLLISVLDVPYRITGTATIWKDVTTDPGTAFEFSRDAKLVVGNASGEGSFAAVGTLALPITFSAATPTITPGFWKGVAFNTGSTANIMNYVEISGGGGPDLGNGYQDTLIGVGLGARLTLSNATVRDSAGWGVYVQTPDFGTAGVLNDSDVTFSNNASGNVGP